MTHKVQQTVALDDDDDDHNDRLVVVISGRYENISIQIYTYERP